MMAAAPYEGSELARVMQHINVSMARAHIKYGNSFETAYTQLLSSTPADRAACETVWEICDASDPGEQLMLWWNGRHTIH
jgi:hypothetical protein